MARFTLSSFLLTGSISVCLVLTSLSLLSFCNPNPQPAEPYGLSPPAPRLLFPEHMLRARLCFDAVLWVP